MDARKVTGHLTATRLVLQTVKMVHVTAAPIAFMDVSRVFMEQLVAHSAMLTALMVNVTVQQENVHRQDVLLATMARAVTCPALMAAQNAVVMMAHV